MQERLVTGGGTEAQRIRMREEISEICQRWGVGGQPELQAAQHSDRIQAREALAQGSDTAEIRGVIYRRRKALNSVHKLRRRMKNLQEEDQRSRIRWMFM